MMNDVILIPLDWKPLKVGKSVYFVSTDGTIYNKKFRPLKPSLKKSGYFEVNLYGEEKPKSALVHRLVAEAFCKKSEGNEVNHINGNKEDNRAENLEWVTRRENLKHAYENGLRKDDVTPKKVIATNISTGEQIQFPSIYNAARFLNISQGNICMVCKGIRPSASGYVFDYIGGSE